MSASRGEERRGERCWAERGKGGRRKGVSSDLDGELGNDVLEE